MTTPFQAALEAGDLAGLRAAPKAELHIHAVLGGCRDFIHERIGQDIAPLEGVLSSMDEMHAWTDSQTAGVFRSATGRALAFEATFVRARKDGVSRMEVGADVWEITLHDNSAQAVWDVLANAHIAGAPQVDWIPQMSFSRHCSVRSLERWMTPLLELGRFRTLDLSGDEFAQPVEVFAPLYRRAKAAGLSLKAHVGEWGTADDVWRAVELLELDEVQHGIAAADSPQVMRALADAGVRLNICPTSNLKLGRVERLEDHPIRRLHDAGVRVTVNTDDPLMFGLSLSEEFLALYQAGVMTAAELDAIRLEGLR
ncbi:MULTISPECIES: amidohydrolase family protein [Phenylobacterium]|uniref:Adenosine deaminase n=1 Tax=Phenylobacterium koreense TaxID=266125 RepID=A0ABV2ELI3_9CAUL